MSASHDHSPIASVSDSHALQRMAQQSQSEFDIEFFGRVLDRAPDNLDVLRCQAELLTRLGNHREAIICDRRLARLLPGDGIVHYNLACSLARLGHSDEAVDRLRYALAHGYDDFDHMRHDTDLDALRDLPRYRALMREYRVA